MAGLFVRAWQRWRAARNVDDLAGLSAAQLREAAAAHRSHLRLVLAVDLGLVAMQLTAQIAHVSGKLPAAPLTTQVEAYPIEFIGAGMLPVILGLFVVIYERMPPVFRWTDKASANGGLLLVGGAAMAQSAQHVAEIFGWLHVIVIDGGALFLMVMAASRIKDRSRMQRRADELDTANHHPTPTTAPIEAPTQTSTDTTPASVAVPAANTGVPLLAAAPTTSRSLQVSPVPSGAGG